MSICQLYNIQVFCSRQFSALCNPRWKVEGRDQKKQRCSKVFYLFVNVVNHMKVLFICAGIKTKREAIYVYIWKISKIKIIISKIAAIISIQLFYVLFDMHIKQLNRDPII